MIVQVVGIIRSTGMYQEKPYDSVRLYGTYSAESVAGLATMSAKCNAAAFERMFGIPAPDCQLLIGETVSVMVDKFGKISDGFIHTGKGV